VSGDGRNWLRPFSLDNVTGQLTFIGGRPRCRHATQNPQNPQNWLVFPRFGGVAFVGFGMLANDRSTASEDAAIRRSSAARSWTWLRPGGRSPRSPRGWGTSAQSISTWRRQDRIDRGLLPGLSSPEKEELAAARRRIAQLETELAVTRRAAELLTSKRPLSTVRGHPSDGRSEAAGAGLLPGAGWSRSPVSTPGAAGHPRPGRPAMPG